MKYLSIVLSMTVAKKMSRGIFVGECPLCPGQEDSNVLILEHESEEEV